VRVLLDHNVPHKLRDSLTDHEVATADEMGWSELENGELLQAAEDAGFAVMVTCDKNMAYQQNLQGRKLALIVLSTNNWNLLKHHSEAVVNAVAVATVGSFEVVTI
jgi:predicted nuclease of predicted toxin-antitoxin system